MAALVVDASVALAWALPDEISAYADAALAAVETSSLRVPEIWPREIANGLAIAALRGRITSGDERAAICSAESNDQNSSRLSGTLLGATPGGSAVISHQ